MYRENIAIFFVELEDDFFLTKTQLNEYLFAFFLMFDIKYLEEEALGFELKSRRDNHYLSIQYISDMKQLCDYSSRVVS